jgi:hypothetical protein
MVAGGGDRDPHQQRMCGAERAQHAPAGGAEGEPRDEHAPADVHARHRRVRVEADAEERAGVVAGEADRVVDPEPGHEARRRGREEREDERSRHEREKERVPERAVDAGPAQPEQDGGRRDQRAEAEQVVGGEEAVERGEEPLQRRLVEEAGGALDGGHVPRVRERLAGIADGDAAQGQVGAVDRDPDRELERRGRGPRPRRRGESCDPRCHGRDEARGRQVSRRRSSTAATASVAAA